MADSAGPTHRVRENFRPAPQPPSNLRPSPQFSRGTATPPLLNEPAGRPSRYSYVGSSPIASPKDSPQTGTTGSTPSLRSTTSGRSTAIAGVIPSASTNGYHGSSSTAPISAPSPSSKYIPPRYQQQLQTPSSPAGGVAAARSYFQNRQSTATTISTQSGGGGGVYGPSPTPAATGDTHLGKRSYGSYFPPYFPQSDLITQAEQLSGTTMLPTIRPVVDTHDTMWADLDIMEDIEEVAEQVANEGNFFGQTHVTALEDLQQAQIELTTTMDKGEDVIDLVADQGKLWEVNDMDIAFAKSSKIFNEDHFDHVQQIVDTVMGKLDKVVDSMKILEGQSRDLWNEKPYQV
ncbi:hypothetical protein POJ06DRAFT_65827 [Lipomyces tetrasporus]|uniref:Uncharacterized protein n=1 Tax=Lipomyces tetrasporus TaxID=54092 RepID=A0AAD7QYA3_9ASCO|nr:uncharacterized protein POJ06DRAFT_65827 [Lipomyces tetrasporus]KAJ8103236.1 hypothetical protein POJ06DRAFT_65827 [Lipomyces tetrasporus]